MKQYLFFIDLPLLEKAFYFLAEETLMKKPLIAYEQIGEDDILEARHNAQGEIEFKKSNKSSAQLILNEIRKYDTYPGYYDNEEKLFYHYHNLFEISIVLSGGGYYFAEGRCIKVKAGSIVAFNGLVPHAWSADKEDPPRLRTFKFYQNLFLENEIEEEQWKLINDYLSTFTVI
ncbi:MAG: AraC family ligand binding domain-containing protein, partial [Clostridiales bacterium]|nr:AraC family ligand binding domain-containing protein [Clostridiales bacterium]